MIWSYGQVSSTGGIACAAEINYFLSFGGVSCLSTHLSNLVAYRFPGGLGFRCSYDFSVRWPKDSRSHHRFLWLVMDSWKNLSSLVSSESKTDSLPEKTGSFSSFPSFIA